MYGNNQFLKLRSLMLSVLLSVFIWSGVNAQVSFSGAQLSFGDVLTTLGDSLSVNIVNSGTEDAEMLTIRLYDPAFSIADSTIDVAAGSNYELYIHFNPRHNIVYNSELVLIGGNKDGNISLDLIGRGVYLDSYYDPTQDLSEEALKTALTNLIDGHVSLGYSGARDEMYMVIDNWKVNGIGAGVNTLETAYTGRLVAGYVDRSDAQTNDNVNTEHTFPQSMFSSAEPMKSDLFHLFVTDANANSQRGNLPFGTVSSPSWTEGGSKKDAAHFEPRDEQKGSTARAMLYFIIRYGNMSSFVDAAQETILTQWHADFPPDTIEMNRNEDIHSVQLNRNPFIDHPEFTDRIHSFINTSVAPELPNIDVIDSEIDLGNVALTDSVFYNLLMVANGNSEISLHNIVFSSSDFVLINADTVIAAGEPGFVKFYFNPQNAGVVNETLTFETDVPGRELIEIPIFGQAEPLGLDEVPALSFHLFPNPATNKVQLQFSDIGIAYGEDNYVQLIDQIGRCVLQIHKPTGNQLVISLEGLAPGLYQLQWIAGRQLYSEKLLKH